MFVCGHLELVERQLGRDAPRSVVHSVRVGFKHCGLLRWWGLAFKRASALGGVIDNFGELNPGLHLGVVWFGFRSYIGNTNKRIHETKHRCIKNMQNTWMCLT